MSTTAATSPSSPRPAKRSTSPSPAIFRSGPVPARSGSIRIRHGDGIGGIATSGARGRSFSLGIADSVTVLAKDGATADAAATLIANAVDCDDPAIERRPANELDPDSDLGDRLVTVSVGALAPAKRQAALAAGLARARSYRDARPDRRRRADAAGRNRDALPVGKSAPRKDRLVTVEVRKIVTNAEEIRHDGGPPLNKPLLKAWVAAVIKNPFAGRYEPEIAPMMDELKPLGLECSQRLVAALGGDATIVEAYGKGSLVGAAGEIEHGALWHVPGGYAMRELLGKALAIVPSTTKVGGMGASIDIPIHHKDAAYVRSHFDSVTAMRAGCAARRRDHVRAGDDDRAAGRTRASAASRRRRFPSGTGNDERVCWPLARRTRG